MEMFWGRMDTCICVAESPHCSLETTRTLLISYTPMQNISGLKKKKFFLKNMKWFVAICDPSTYQLT